MPSTPQPELDRDPQQLTVRLQEVGGRLLLTAGSDAARPVAAPVRQCVAELRAVWSALRGAALDFDPSRLGPLQQRQRELGVVLETLGGTARRLGASSGKASAAMDEELAELDELDGLRDARLLAECLRAMTGRVRGAAAEVRDEGAHSAKELHHTGLLLRNIDRELDRTHESDPRDPLTRAASRHALEQRLAELSAQPSLIGGYWCLALVEVDNIEAVNRKLGERVGDALLFRVAAELQEACDYHPGALVARTGGKEFGVLLPGCPLSLGRRMAEHARTEVERCRWACKVSKPGAVLSTTVSVGVAEHTEGETAEALLQRAERCLDQARQAGRNTVVADG